MASLEIVDKIIAEVPQDFHISGSLSQAVLRRIAVLHQEVGAKVSAETGCGLTTLILSHLSEEHTSFTVDFGDSLPNTRDHVYFNHGTTSFIINPTQASLPKHEFTKQLDFAILDGPHAYPFPDLEYFYFYPLVRPGGILVIDDVHIPTIGHLYDFLLDDEMWEHLGDVETTAFFKRTTAPTLNPYGDGWPSQRYNRRYFEYPQALNHMYGEGWHEADFGGPIPAGTPVAKFISAKQAEKDAAKKAEETLAAHTELEARVDAAMTALDAAKSELSQSQAKFISAEQAEKDAAKKAEEALATHTELEARIATIMTALDAAKSELSQSQAALAEARQTVKAMKSSTSWRLTAPVRALKRVFAS